AREAAGGDAERLERQRWRAWRGRGAGAGDGDRDPAKRGRSVGERGAAGACAGEVNGGRMGTQEPLARRITGRDARATSVGLRLGFDFDVGAVDFRVFGGAEEIAFAGVKVVVGSVEGAAGVGGDQDLVPVAVGGGVE